MWILRFRRSILGYYFVSAKGVNGPAIPAKDAPAYVRDFVESVPAGTFDRGVFVRSPGAGGADGPWWAINWIGGDRYEFTTLQRIINPNYRG